MQETWVCSLGPRVRALEKERQPTPVFLPGESHGKRSLVGYSPQGRKKSDTTERLNNNSSSVTRDPVNKVPSSGLHSQKINEK